MAPLHRRLDLAGLVVLGIAGAVLFGTDPIVNSIFEVAVGGDAVRTATGADGLGLGPRLALAVILLFGAMVLIFGIRAKRRTDGELRERQAYLRAVIDHSPSIIHLKDLSGRFVLVNRVFEERFGPSGSVIGKTSHDLFPIEDADEYVACEHEAIATLSPVHRTAPVIATDGKSCHHAFTIFPVPGPDGRPIGVGTISADVTDCKRIEEALRESEARLRAVIDHSPSTMQLKDLSGRFVLANRAFAEMTGVSPAAVIGKTSRDFFPMPLADEFEADHRLVVETKAKVERERPIKAPNGDERLIHCVKFPVSGADGRLVGVGTVATDITEQRRMDDDLRRAKDGAEAANRAKTEFLARMSHELRTPLNAILGFAQLLELGANDPLTERQKGHLQPILTAGQHLLGLIEEILDLTRVESGTPVDSIGEVSPQAVLAEALAFVGPLAEKSGIRVIDESPPGELPWVRVDPARAKQALLNLLSNAIKFNRPAGSMTVRVAVDGNGMVRFSVADTGPGIPEGRQAELFTPFNRLGADEKGIQGTGLGLAITKQVIERMGGRVGFSSVEGRGSTFWIDLPLAGAARLDGGGRG